MSRFDPQLYDLIPHREPMLLINEVLRLDHQSSSARVLIDEQAPFFEREKGVPSWIGIEYMGQTAALIAGYQKQQGMIGEHLGFLLGARNYRCQNAYFTASSKLTVSCTEVAVVGDGLATFDCTIDDHSGQRLASGKLSVFRQSMKE